MLFAVVANDNERRKEMRSHTKKKHTYVCIYRLGIQQKTRMTLMPSSSQWASQPTSQPTSQPVNMCVCVCAWWCDKHAIAFYNRFATILNAIFAIWFNCIGNSTFSLSYFSFIPTMKKKKNGKTFTKCNILQYVRFSSYPCFLLRLILFNSLA